MIMNYVPFGIFFLTVPGVSGYLISSLRRLHNLCVNLFNRCNAWSISYNLFIHTLKRIPRLSVLEYDNSDRIYGTLSTADLDSYS